MPRFQTVAPNEYDPVARICVIGAGLVGGSIALAAQKAGCSVTVYDVDPETSKQAAACGLTVAESPAEAVGESQVVFMAVPTETVLVVAPMIRGALRPGVIVSDVASVKTPLHGLRGLLGTTGAEVILGHPMAGSQHAGFAAARPNLFEGCTWLLCDAARPAAGRLAALLHRLGAARVIDCPADGHDTIVAVSSHLPQIAATALAASVGHAEETIANGALEVTGGGFRDSTRIAESPYTMWKPILKETSTVLVMLLNDLTERLDQAATKLAGGESLEELFAEGNKCRRAWREIQPGEASLERTPEMQPLRWRDQDSGFEAWLDSTLAWETIRTSAAKPAEHALVSARYVAHILRDSRGGEISADELNLNEGHAKAVAGALAARDLGCSYKDTWTADGIHVEGIELPGGRFLVVI